MQKSVGTEVAECAHLVQQAARVVGQCTMLLHCDRAGEVLQGLVIAARRTGTGWVMRCTLGWMMRVIPVGCRHGVSKALQGLVTATRY